MGDTQSEALAKREAYKRQEEAGRMPPACCCPITSGNGLQPINTMCLKTVIMIMCALNAFVAIVGDKALRDVVQMMYNGLITAQAGYSKSHITKFAQVVRAMFAATVADRIVPYSPCLAAKPPAGAAGTHRAITDAERNLVRGSLGKKSLCACGANHVVCRAPPRKF